MIVIDTSALMAMLLDEPEKRAIAACLKSSARASISAGTLVECAAVSRRRGVAPRMAALIDGIAPEVLPVDAETVGRLGVADARWGRGVHPAGLNFGDLFAYDAARTLGAPLLYVGEDFARTDVRAALAQGSER